jgi:thiamine biosynthesis protein ThiS
MKITLNGEKKEFEEPIKITDILTRLKIKNVALAIEINKNILPKSEYDSYMIKDGDVIEIVQFIGGG